MNTQAYYFLAILFFISSCRNQEHENRKLVEEIAQRYNRMDSNDRGFMVAVHEKDSLIVNGDTITPQFVVKNFKEGKEFNPWQLKQTIANGPWLGLWGYSRLSAGGDSIPVFNLDSMDHGKIFKELAFYDTRKSDAALLKYRSDMIKREIRSLVDSVNRLYQNLDYNLLIPYFDISSTINVNGTLYRGKQGASDFFKTNRNLLKELFVDAENIELIELDLAFVSPSVNQNPSFSFFLKKINNKWVIHNMSGFFKAISQSSIQ
jgi:hypothetical protein